MEGLEPTRREAPDPKSGMATNYITSANEHCSFLMTANIDTFYFKPKHFSKKINFLNLLASLYLSAHFYYFYSLTNLYHGITRHRKENN